jgi:hypothetical protein
MGILDKTGAAMGDRTSKTDIALAEEIADKNNRDAIVELITGLNNADKNVQGSCLKVIYETGYIEPKLIADHWEVYLSLLDRKNNRLVWGGMIALWGVAKAKPEALLPHAERIFRAAKYGTRITTDGGVNTLGAIGAASPEYAAQVMPYILELLAECPAKKLPAYAEATVIAVTPGLKDDYLKLFDKRTSEMDENQLKRLNKALSIIGASV